MPDDRQDTQATRTPFGARVKSLDENTSIHTKLGVALAVIAAAVTTTHWGDSQLTIISGDHDAIANLTTEVRSNHTETVAKFDQTNVKLDRVEAKLDAISGTVSDVITVGRAPTTSAIPHAAAPFKPINFLNRLRGDDTASDPTKW